MVYYIAITRFTHARTRAHENPPRKAQGPFSQARNRATEDLFCCNISEKTDIGFFMRKLLFFRIWQLLSIFQIKSQCQPEDTHLQPSQVPGRVFRLLPTPCLLPAPWASSGWVGPGSPRTRPTGAKMKDRGACPRPGHANRNVTSSPKAVVGAPSDDSKVKALLMSASTLLPA